jgi:hypothetical protein
MELTDRSSLSRLGDKRGIPTGRARKRYLPELTFSGMTLNITSGDVLCTSCGISSLMAFETASKIELEIRTSRTTRYYAPASVAWQVLDMSDISGSFGDKFLAS